MCGIAFSYQPDISREALSRSMVKARQTMGHRGPDSAGQIIIAPWSMGHQRLSVIDPQGSSQPMADPSGRYFLSYNGELYNYRELRQRLEERWRFVTDGDAEVVLAGLCIYNIDFLKLMEGMWALAFWDQREQVLLLVRDRLGKKPLYYCGHDDQFACASELRALHAASGRRWQEDGHSTADYFRYGFFLPGTTAYKGVYEVLPAHWLRWSPGKNAVIQPYWQLSPGGFNGSKKNAAAMIKEAFLDSVRLRMVADVEVGALLSGGIDSSLVLCAMTRQRERPVSTFTIGFHEPSYDERRYARAMAEYCHADHHERILTWEDSDALVGQVLNHLAQPFGDASLIPAAMISRMASAHLKVVQSGDGGDELFGGYQRYLARSCMRWLTRLPQQVIGRMPQWANTLSGLGLNDNFVGKIIRAADMVQRMQDEIPYVAPLSYDRVSFRRLLRDHWRKGHPAPNLPKVSRVDEIRKMMVADALIYLPQDILTKMDRAGMAFSLEVRSPFLDRRVVELAFSLPRHWHRWGLKGKLMLRTAFDDLLPDWIWKRPKRGFAVPLDDWFRSGLQHRLMDLLSETSHPLASTYVGKMVSAHVSGQWNHGMRLWHIYIYLRWLASKPFPYAQIGPSVRY